jgi:hypothetical protein
LIGYGRDAALVQVRAADGFEGWSVPAANRVRRSNAPELK